LTVGSEAISDLYLGNMGIKSAFVGEELQHERVSSYVYIEFYTERKSQNG